MEQLANYIITHVRHGSTPGKIAEFRVLERKSGEFEDRGLMERSELIELIKDDERVFVWSDDDETLGGEVEIVRVHGETFLRTDGERLRADNVGDVPEV